MSVLNYKDSSTMETKKETDTPLKCPHCNRICVNGISDFYSLINGSTNIKKTCKKCRISTYKSYKKNNPDKFKNKEEKKNIDYTDEIKDHKRCPQCKRKTMGISDYKHYRENSDKICKTCKRCRLGVLESYRKRKKKTVKKKKTKTEQIEDLKELIRKIDEDIDTSTL